MRLLLWPLLAALAGCATTARVVAAPTVDTAGRFGAMLTITVGLGASYRHGRAALFLTGDTSGAIDARPGGHVALGLGADVLGESPHFGFRIGPTLSGRVPLPYSGAAGGSVGGRLALLPVVKYRHVESPGPCGERSTSSSTYFHLGLELAGSWLFGPDARGMFSFGPVFELDALSQGGCV